MNNLLVQNSDTSGKVRLGGCQPMIAWHQDLKWLPIGFQIMEVGTKDTGKVLFEVRVKISIISTKDAKVALLCEGG